MQHISKIILLDADHSTLDSFTMIEFTERYAVNEPFLQELTAHGFANLEVIEQNALRMQITDLQRVLSALRLQQDLEINTAGLALVFDLMDQLEDVRQELKLYQKHFE